MQIVININEGAVDVLPQPKQTDPTPYTFRDDMNVKLAMEELANLYLDEAMRQVGTGHGCKTAAAKLLGFKSYQAFVYWVKRRENSSSDSPVDDVRPSKDRMPYQMGGV
jgi:hypothetical protein